MQCYHWNRLRVVAVLAAGIDSMCLYLSLFSIFTKLFKSLVVFAVATCSLRLGDGCGFASCLLWSA